MTQWVGSFDCILRQKSELGFAKDAQIGYPALSTTGFSGCSLSGGADMPMESLTLKFTTITETFSGMDPGVSGSPETVGYDLTQMKTV